MTSSVKPGLYLIIFLCEIYSQWQSTDISCSTNNGQAVHTYVRASVTKQYNLVPAKGRWWSAAGKVTTGLAESNDSLYRRVDDLNLGL